MSTDKSRVPHFGKTLLKQGSIVSMGVLSSRVLGFFRDVLLAHFLGTGLVAEAFLVAQRIPNLFRDLVGEGAANAAIVPVVSQYQEKNTKEEWLTLVNVIMAWGAIILGIITLLGVIFAGAVVSLMAPGFTQDPIKYALTVDLTRIMFPYLILIALTAFQTGILYSLRSFFAPAFGPCLLNIVMILSVWVAVYFSLDLAYVLSAGVLLGGVLQFGAQWLALRRHGVFWRWPKSLNHEGAKKVLKLLLPRLWGSGVYQVNIIVDTFCASLSGIVGLGGIAALYYANRIILFPLGVFGYAAASVSLPSLSRIAASGDMEKFKTTVLFAMRNLTLVLVVFAVFFLCCSQWIIHIIFERGAFDAYSAKITGEVLFYSALGLPFYGLSRILASAFYALHDTKAPVKAAAMCLGINIVLNLILMFPLKVGGIALASSIASMANTWMLWTQLNRKLKASL
jgi:putative peptidoglycan lipid II flippase